MNNDPIKAKIIELVPEICTEGWVSDKPIHEAGKFSRPRVKRGMKCRPITLADVLRAWQIEQPGDSSFAENIGDVVQHWNLTTDYNGQTQEVKTFIGSLLGL